MYLFKPSPSKRPINYQSGRTPKNQARLVQGIWMSSKVGMGPTSNLQCLEILDTGNEEEGKDEVDEEENDDQAGVGELGDSDKGDQ